MTQYHIHPRFEREYSHFLHSPALNTGKACATLWAQFPTIVALVSRIGVASCRMAAGNCRSRELRAPVTPRSPDMHRGPDFDGPGLWLC